MDFREHMLVELRLRSQMLFEEIAAWQQLSTILPQQYGLHQSQFKAIRDMLKDFGDEESRLYDVLANITNLSEFALEYKKLGAAMLRGMTIVAIFRHILSQRVDLREVIVAATQGLIQSQTDVEPQTREIYEQTLRQQGLALVLADLIVAHCYKWCLDRAVDFEIIGPKKRRVPPLTYFNTQTSPRALTMGVHQVSGMGLYTPTPIFSETMKLPVSVIALPFHSSTVVWNYCGLYHEVGHILNHDLELKRRLSRSLRRNLQAGRNRHPRMCYWEMWLVEIIADAVGILLGGAPFVKFMLAAIFATGRHPAINNVSPQVAPPKSHPPDYIRMGLLVQMLRTLNVPALSQEADEIEVAARQVLGEPEVMSAYKGDYGAIAEALLNTPLKRNGSRALRNLMPTVEIDSDLVRGVASFLRGASPEPEHAATGFGFRLLPAASFQAISEVTQQHKQAYGAIQQQTLAYGSRLPRPTYLDASGQGAARRRYFRKLVQDFMAVDNGEDFE